MKNEMLSITNSSLNFFAGNSLVCSTSLVNYTSSQILGEIRNNRKQNGGYQGWSGRRGRGEWGVSVDYIFSLGRWIEVIVTKQCECKATELIVTND